MTPWDLATWLAVGVLALSVLIILIALLRDLGSLSGPRDAARDRRPTSRER